MNSTIKRTIQTMLFGFAAFIFSITVYAQQDNTLFFMHKVPQSSWVNPAIISECNFHIGGAAIPITGQVFMPVYFNYSNNGFTYDDILHKGTGAYSDSLITPFHPNSPDDNGLDEFLNKLDKHNYINLSAHINLFSVGYKWKDKYYFTFNINEKADFRFNFSRDLIEFATKGNANSLGRTMNLEYGVNFRHYREYNLGVATTLSDRIVVGGRYKMLFGKSNIQTRDNYVNLNTHPLSFAWQLDSKMNVSTSSPFLDILELEYFPDQDSLAFEIDTTLADNFSAKDYMMNRKNFGSGIDVGAIFNVTDKLKIHASVLDLGFIRWKDHSETITAEGEFKFKGINIVPYLEQDMDVNHDSAYQDTIINTFSFKHSDDPYNMWFNPKVYIGATYQLHKMVNVGILTRTEIYHHGRLHSSVILSGNATFTNWLAFSLNYSIMHNNYANIGSGLYIRGGWFQFFFITDNLMAAFIPHKTQNVNWRMGCNLAFGCNKKKGDVMF